MIRRLRHLARDNCGAVIIETAIVTPVLLLMALGAFDASMMVSRQVELQNAAAEAGQVALAAAPKTAAERTVLEAIIEKSIEDPRDADVEGATVVEKFRCGTDAELVDAETDCGETPYAHFVQITLTDTYTPLWATIAFGTPVSYNVVRTVQVG